MHGKVERKIKEVKKSIITSFNNHRFSILQWETIVTQIANSINNMPLALNSYTDHEISDILTPNRLFMGRNNDRSLSSPGNPDKFIKQNTEVFNAWFEVWLTTHVPKLMYQPKWFKNDYDINVGDIVLFIKQDTRRYGGGVGGVTPPWLLFQSANPTTVFKIFTSNTDSSGKS